MFLQGGIGGFRAGQMIQDKAQAEENGRVLFKDCNAVLDHLTCSLRTTASRLAEPTNTALQEH